MPELATEFHALPPKYQAVLRLAQETFRITITPLDLLVGGWSGAVVYLVSVSSPATNLIEHCILKLDRKSKSSRSDEVTRHQAVLKKSSAAFARAHIAEPVFGRVEQEGAIAIFYRIAGQSLLKYLPLSKYERQSQLKSIFAATNRVLLTEWNADASFRQAAQPQNLLETWLGFRLDPGANTERFLREVCKVDPDSPGVMINGHVFPNPLLHARTPEVWGKSRSLDVVTGFLHGDLNTNNILVKFAADQETLEGYYLIDFALFKEAMPLLYDQRYLEMSYLAQALSEISLPKRVNFLTLLAVADVPDPYRVPIETSGISAVLASVRGVFTGWVEDNHPSLHDDLWGQYWLAGVAAGLSYCHKTGLAEDLRLAGLIYAAANLKRYAALFPLPTPGRVVELYNEGSSSATGHIRAVAESSHNLPSQPTAFVGREQEIVSIQKTLLDTSAQLVTLTGPGGTGKTRLSLELARRVLDRFPDGVFLVSLGDVTDPDQVVTRIAQTLEVRSAGSQPLFQNLKEYLRDRSTLLVLDNFEQLLPAAPVVAELLTAAPSLKILVTSRILLNLRGEHEFPISPLAVPDLGERRSIDDLSANESVSLFVTRARAAQPGFTLTESNAAAVAQICQRLDGLPLAIELAAARVKMLPPQAMLVRLGDRLKFLTGGAKDLPNRQQTLRNTLDWSHSLLQSQEKTLYARLAVFVGGFTLEAAEAVCNPEAGLDILEGVSSLVNNSLLQHEPSTVGEPRFHMLATVREYAWERLAESGELSELQQSHALYYAGMIRKEASPGIVSREATYWLNRLEREHANIQAMLEWTQTAPGQQGLAYDLLSTLTWFWYRRGFFSEGRMWTDRILDASNPQHGPERAAALEMNSRMAMWRGDLKTAVVRSSEGLSLWQRLEDERSVAMSLMETGVVYINMGKDEQAHTLLTEAEALLRENGPAYFHAITLVHLGNVSLGLGNPVEARGWLEKAYPIFKEIGEEWGLAFVLNNQGEVARVQGEFEQAYGYYKESEGLLRTTGDQGDLARLVHTLGYIAAHRNDPAQAEAQFRESLAMFRKLGNKRGIAECIAGLAGLKAGEGDVQTATTMLGASEALLGAIGADWWPADRIEVETTRGLLQAALEPAAFAQAWAKGQAMSLEQAIAFVEHG